jgi:type II secretion system protein I
MRIFRNKKTASLLSAQGFTLMEVLVALSVLALGLTAVIHAVAENQDGVLAAREMTIAGTLAASKMDEIQAVGLEEFSADSGRFDPEFPDYFWTLDTPREIAPDLVLAGLRVGRGEQELVTVERIFCIRQ